MFLARTLTLLAYWQRNRNSCYLIFFFFFLSSLHRAEDDSVCKETTQSHCQWWFVNFSTVQIKNAQDSFNMTNDSMMYRLAELSKTFFLSWESSNVHINHSHWIYWMFSSVSWLFQVQQHSKWPLPLQFLWACSKPSQSPQRPVAYSHLGCSSWIFPIWVAELWGLGALTRKDLVA